MAEDQLQMFGGDWTEQKLKVLKEYLERYTTALKNNRYFKKAYIDAFAGTGYREERVTGVEIDNLFEELAADEPQRFRDGSARIALRTTPEFDSFAFIESSTKRVAELERLKIEFPKAADEIHIWKGDANTILQNWCEGTDWKRWRAVAFLDPYGMQVDWSTIEAIAETQAIDVWILFPLGIGANRLLTQKLDDIPISWRNRLDRLFGTKEWQQRFYRQDSPQPTMFGTGLTQPEMVKMATLKSIGEFYQERLKKIFAEVADNPRLLCNSQNSPLYQLHFAAANPKGAPIALRIAQHILGHV